MVNRSGPTYVWDEREAEEEEEGGGDARQVHARRKKEEKEGVRPKEEVLGLFENKTPLGSDTSLSPATAATRSLRCLHCY
jgi:hypothetical protein